MTNHIDNLFVCSFVICVSLLVLRYLENILVGLSAFVLLNFKSCLRILDTSPLSEMCLPNIFSELVSVWIPYVKKLVFFITA